MSIGWLKRELVDAHQALDSLGAPKSVRKNDWDRGQCRYVEKEFTLSVADRIRWVRENCNVTMKGDTQPNDKANRG